MLLVAVAFVACGTSPYPGFKEVGPETYIRLHRLGEGERAPLGTDSVLMRIRIAPVSGQSGSLFSTQRYFLADDLNAAGFKAVMNRMHEGDSLSAIMRSGALDLTVLGPVDRESVKDPMMLAMEFLLLQVRSVEEINAEQEALRNMEPGLYEERAILRHVHSEQGPWVPWGTSLMHYSLGPAPGDTTRPALGDQVRIHVIGSRLSDAKVFDDSRAAGEPLSFRFGDPDQVLRGIEVAVSLLAEGQRGRFILPSDMAFGARGSAGGIIAPNDPVRYEVELVSVQRRAD